MPKVGTRSYTLEVKDTIKNKTIAIEPPTEIQFEITMAMYTQLSIGHIKIYNPDMEMKNFLMYKYPVGSEKNRLYIDLKFITLGYMVDKVDLGSITVGNSSVSLGSASFATGTGYNYCGSTKAYVYQTTLVHPNAKDEYIHLQLLAGLWDVFSLPFTTKGNSTKSSTYNELKDIFEKSGYALPNLTLSDGADTYSKKGTPNSILVNLLNSNDKTSYFEDGILKVADNRADKGKGSKGSLGSWQNPFQVTPENGLISYPQQINNDCQFLFTLDHKFPLDSYVKISRDLINRQLVTPSLSGGAGSLNWLLGAEDKYRVLSYTLMGDYFDPSVWHQKVVVQAGNMPLAANLQNPSIIGAS